MNAEEKMHNEIQDQEWFEINSKEGRVNAR